jgi:hypothetical protein
MKARLAVPAHILPVIVLIIWMLVPSLFAAIKTEEIPDLKPPQGALPEEIEKRSFWPFVIALAGIAAGLVLLWPRRPTPRIAETPFIQAMRELNGSHQPDAVTISSIVRRYIVQTFPTAVPGQTFEELATVLSREPLWTTALRERLRLLTDPLEIAKFAPPGNPADLQRLRNDASTLLTDLHALHRPPVTASA